MNLIYEYAPTTGLIFFFTFFLWAAYQAYRPSAKKQLQEYAHIPLAEDNHHDQ